MTIKLPWQSMDESTAKRVQRFAQLTGLKPSLAHQRVFGEHGERYPHGADHTNVWRDGASYVITTEPYRTADTSGLESWCTLHGWIWRTVADLDMWNPPHTILYLLSPPMIGGDIERILRRVVGRSAKLEPDR